MADAARDRMLEVRVPVRWRDMDAYGHVNNATYLTYLEECRDALVQRLLGRLGDGWDFVLARVAIDYRRQVAQSDGEVVVRCGVASVGRSSIRTREEIRTREGVVCAEAESVIVPVVPGEGRSRPLTEDERRALSPDASGGATS
jgi:acyl-CoA thioester hydrolase